MDESVKELTEEIEKLNDLLIGLWDQYSPQAMMEVCIYCLSYMAAQNLNNETIIHKALVDGIKNAKSVKPKGHDTE